jgi:hypothetical protein
MEGRTKTPPVTSRHAVLLFFSSASLLAYEIFLMRLVSIGFWYHFAYMVISLALLGVGAAGSFLFLLSRRVYKKMEVWLVLLAGAASLSFPVSFSLAKEIGLYSKPQVQLLIGKGRQSLHRTHDRFDLIQLSLLN